MTALSALRDGVGRVRRAPALLAGAYLLTLLLALPPAAVVGSMIGAHLGASLAGQRLAAGFDVDWWQEFARQASGLGTTFGPQVIGGAAVVANLGALVDATPQAPAVAGAVLFYILCWIFLSGGILDRLARNRPTRAAGFFAASGVFFFRFLRLSVAVGAAYLALYLLVHPWLFGRLYPSLTRDLTVEWQAFAIRAAFYALFVLLLALVNLLADYAKVRAVVEDRRSMSGAIAAGARFVARHPGRVVGLYLLNASMWAALVFVYLVAAPGARGPAWWDWTALAVGQAYILGRIWMKLQFAASAVALFQGELAHAGYAASPVPEWPVPPAVEVIGPPDGA